jgi:hypothetical protein
MIKKRIIFSTVILLFLFLPTGNLLAGEKGTQKNSPPFLITGKLPHLTKLLMQQWENTELHLSDEQKGKLLVIRKETISSVQSLGKEIGTLEKQVVEGSLSGKTPEEMQALVQDIAKLKSEATMVHLRCIYNTSNILDKKQLDFLKN